MAINIVSSNYSGEKALGYIAPSILNGKTISGGYITLLPKVKYKTTLQIADLSNAIQADSCSFTPQGDITLTQRELEPFKYKVNLEYCKSTLELNYEATQMKAGANNLEAPEFEKWLADRIAAEVAIGMDQAIWIGDTAGSGGIYAQKPFLTENDGIYTLAKADTGVTSVTATAITSSNVQAELTKVYNAIPTEILEADDLKIFVAHDVYRAYALSLPQSNTYQYDIQSGTAPKLYFIGKEVVSSNLPAGKMLVARVSNLFAGTDLTADYAQYSVLDMAMLDGSDNLKIKMRFSVDSNYALPSEIVIYK